jgi:hypothetical protein
MSINSYASTVKLEEHTIFLQSNMIYTFNQMVPVHHNNTVGVLLIQYATTLFM